MTIGGSLRQGPENPGLAPDGASAELGADPIGSRGELNVPGGPSIAGVRVPPVAAASLVMAAGDLLVLLGALSLSVMLRTWLNRWLPIGIHDQMLSGVSIAVLLLPLAYAAARLYPGYGLMPVERLRKRVTVSAFCFAAMILFDRVAQDGQWSRGILLGAAAISLFAVPVWDAIAVRLLRRWGWWGEPVVVLGPADRRPAVIEALAKNGELGWIPVAQGEVAPGRPAAARGLSLAIVVMPDDVAAASAIADELPYRRVVLVPNMQGVPNLWVSARDLGTHLGLEMRRNLLIPSNRIAKRALDLLLGSLLLLLAAPVIAAFGLATALVSPGPVFFTQQRRGLDGRPFRMWKLRSMIAAADLLLDATVAASEQRQGDWERAMKLRDDPRIIPGVGHFMRRFSIDELPQLWNVLRGDMSLVGPRPLPDYHLARLDHIAGQMRQRVRPGITGLWQVSGRGNASVAELEHLDTYYVRNWSIWLDIHILARTVLVVLDGRGAY